MKRLISFILMSLILMVTLTLPVQSARAATNGQIRNVCVVGQTLYVTVSAVGVTQDTPTGDQIGIIVDSILAFWTSIPADQQTHTVIASFQLTGAQLQLPLSVQGGSGDGNRNPVGAPFAGSGTYAAVACTSIPGSGAIAGAPAGFVLHTIACTVAVFDTPGGQPVGANVILDGQTWFVNPTPVADKLGRSWTEIYVGGPIDGYIPTVCVV